MTILKINNTDTSFLSISEITDSLSENAANFSVELLGFSNTTKLGQLVEIYSLNTSQLVAIGNVQQETIKFSARPKTELTVVGYSQFLNWYPITGKYQGTIRNIVNQLIIDAQLTGIIIGSRFLTNSLAPETEVSLSLSYQFINQALQQLLSLSGFPLQYRIPISEKIIEIFEPGFGNLAPIYDLDLSRLYSVCGLGLEKGTTNYTKLPPIASKILVYGRKGLLSSANNPNSIIDIVRYTSKGENQFKGLENTDELIKVLVTQPETGDCIAEIVISGSNYTENNELFLFDIELPDISTDPVSYVYTADITNIKPSTNLSFYFTGLIDTTEANLSITFNAIEIYNQNLSVGLLNLVNIVSLAAYEGQSGELIATLTLPAQPSTTTAYQGFLIVDCCAIDTIAGTGTAGFNGDGLSRLSTQFNDISKTRKDSNGNLYVADNLNYRLRKIDTSGIVTTIGGNGNAAITPPTDGGLAINQDFGQINDFVIIGTNIYLLLPDWDYVAKIDLLTGNYHLIDDDFGGSFGLTSIAKDSLGNIYYSKFNNAIVYKLESETTRTIYAGIFNSAGFSGDGGLATSAQLKFPAGLACDSEDNLYIGATDASGNRYLIRKVTKTTGIIGTICGNGSFTTFDIDAADFQTNDDHNPSIAVDISTNDIYFTTEGIILKINNSDNKINRFCGINDASGSGFDGDTGAPLTAILNLFGAFFGGIDVVSATEIYIADEANNRVRQIYCGDPINPNFCLILSWVATGIFSSVPESPTEAGFSIQGSALGVSATGNFTVEIALPASPTYFWEWLEYSLNSLVPSSIFDTGGFIEVYIDGSFITQRQIVAGNGQVSSGTDLTPYANTTVTLEFRYNGSTYSSAGFTGSFEYTEIKVCPN